MAGGNWRQSLLLKRGEAGCRLRESNCTFPSVRSAFNYFEFSDEEPVTKLVYQCQSGQEVKVAPLLTRLKQTLRGLITRSLICSSLMQDKLHFDGRPMDKGLMRCAFEHK